MPSQPLLSFIFINLFVSYSLGAQSYMESNTRIITLENIRMEYMVVSLPLLEFGPLEILVQLCF
jgi:hypothetical protein